jgi:hypothetical protein
MGYQTFDTNVNIVGVILNKVAGERHESKLVQAIEYYTDIPVLGAVRRSNIRIGITPCSTHAVIQTLVAFNNCDIALLLMK